MAKKNKNNKNSNSIEKDVILRSKDIIPPFNNPDKASQSTSQDKRQQEVPRFDLAEAIMAKHRTITAIKRKSPNQQFEPLRAFDEFQTKENARHPAIESIEEKQVVREIVSRDIESLCREERVNS